MQELDDVGINAEQLNSTPPDLGLANGRSIAPINTVSNIPPAPRFSIGRKSGQARRPRSIFILRCVAGIVLLAIAAAALVLGLRLRAWTWEQTGAIHFYPDVNNGIHWGGQADEPAANPRGLLNVYDVVAATAPVRASEPQYGLDYAPLRLWFMTRWVQWATRLDPKIMKAPSWLRWHMSANHWNAPYALFTPTLRFNDAMEIIAAIGLFVLTRYWVIRGERRIGASSRAGFAGAVLRPFRGCVAGLIAALLFWFSPAVLLSTHAWPTWDEWIIPFFIWAIFLACTEWWFAAGIVIAFGAMLKGQQWFVAPLFVLWPLLLGKWESSLRWIAGAIFAVAVIASPWLLTTLPGGATAQTVAADRRLDGPAIACTASVLACLIALPIVLLAWQRKRGTMRPINLFADPRYWIGSAMLLGLTIVGGAARYNGSFAWMDIGWGYGTRHYPYMVQGLTDNLAGLLEKRFDWHSLTDIAMHFDAHPLRLWPTHRLLFAAPTDITIRALLVSIYVVTFLACVVAMAIQARRNDPRFLVAMTGTWLMFFTWMPQIHERYLLFAAGAGCTMTALGVGLTLLDVFMMLLTAVMTLHVMLVSAFADGRLGQFATAVSPTFAFNLRRFCNGTFPDAGWAVMLLALMFLYLAFRRSPVKG